MNELEMTLAIKQMFEEIGISRLQDVKVSKISDKHLVITWTVQGKCKSYKIVISKLAG